MSVTKAEEFVRELIDNQDFQIETLTIIKNMIGSFDNLMDTMDENDFLALALPAANQLGYECTSEELANAFVTVSKEAGEFKIIGFQKSLRNNVKKVNENSQADI